MPRLHITFLTTFPEIFPGPLGLSLSGKALEKGIWSYDIVNIRNFGITKHKKVDDVPYGGGSGMVVRPDVLSSAIDFALKKNSNSRILYTSPRGQVMNQQMVQDIVSINNQSLIIICLRFEGIDQRVLNYYNIEEVSLGDFILSGGEIAALALADSCIRLLEGVVENTENLKNESFNPQGELEGLLEYPLYTRPQIWKGLEVPQVLLSGHHEEIKQWRRNASLEITKLRRPDLLVKNNK